MTLQDYIINKALEKASIEMLKTVIKNNFSIPFMTRELWLNQLDKFSKLKDVIELLSILYPQNRR